MKSAALAIPVLIFALGGCAVDGQVGATPTPTPEPFSASGTITVPMDISASLPLQDGNPTIGNPCVPQAGYSDIESGAQVTVANAAGETIAVGQLSPNGLQNGPSGDAFYQSVCEFAISVDDIPPTSKFYSVHVGNTNRGEQTFTAAQLKDGIALTLG
ncbi:hypothetical protein [Curtobacterium sp. DN_7.5]|uniref:hypothetical protein n=1 Tax=Curtobacterium sp. DN_7.5 TaxID=3049047 RepID=UPI001F58B3D3|nr:hypothetical protein [Curtobacterium sp. DN_7.5]